MRDLAARLREIVRADRGPRVEAPLPDVAEDCRPAGGCLVVDHAWDGDAWHGRRQVASYAPGAGAPLALFDPRAARRPDWASRVLFFDIETTGLSGGAGTLAFLAGCGWFEADGFRVRQYFLGGPAGERAMLDALAADLSAASLIVTFNGRTFDLPTMAMRWAFHRLEGPGDDLPHFDMLPAARRLWRGRDDDSGCSLGALERSVLGFHRVGDVPGLEIPVRYFHYLRTGDLAAVEGVLAHNRLDLLSLAAITGHALRLAADGPGASRDAGETAGLGRLYERAGDLPRAGEAYERAAAWGEPDVRAHALARLAVLRRREGRYGEAAAAWQAVLDVAAAEGVRMAALARLAAEALAIHHEHRGRDPVRARDYAEALRRIEADGAGRRAPARAAAAVEHRLRRLDRKIAAGNTTGGPEAARLLPDE